jgi:tetraacyldisaccharide 4'-kinase
MTLATRLRRLLESSWYGDTGPILLLMPFAWVYGAVVQVRRFAYERGLLRRPVLSVPVIVVGNVTVGGTGKTPIVAWLAQQLVAMGYRPGIVSRGYGVNVHRSPVLVQSEEAVVYGDEPVLLARKTGCPICVCVDRSRAVRRLVDEGVNVVISDDGLQHYRMCRVMEIVVVDGERGFGNGQLLPAGPLREPVARAQEADAVVVNGPVDRVAGFQFHLEHQGFIALDGLARAAVGDFVGQRVWAVAGIGNPQRFYRELHAAGIHVDETDVADHGNTDIVGLRRLRAQPVLMTEKDAVKYHQQHCDDAWYMPVTAAFAPEAAASILSLVKTCLESRS